VPFVALPASAREGVGVLEDPTLRSLGEQISRLEAEVGVL
jgi:hypothetical protein